MGPGARWIVFTGPKNLIAFPEDLSFSKMKDSTCQKALLQYPATRKEWRFVNFIVQISRDHHIRLIVEINVAESVWFSTSKQTIMRDFSEQARYVENRVFVDTLHLSALTILVLHAALSRLDYTQ